MWWVRAGWWSSELGPATKCAASRPTHPSRSLDAADANGTILHQSRGPIGSPRPNASSRLIGVSLMRPPEGVDASS
jgi:hypothetical protein